MSQVQGGNLCSGITGGLKEMGAYRTWEETKRAFTRDEISTGWWVKIGDHGFTYVIQFRPDGSLFEYDIFNSGHTNNGTWELVNGALKTHVTQNEQEGTFNYLLYVLGKKESGIHSGVETRNDVLSAYFKLIRLG